MVFHHPVLFFSCRIAHADLTVQWVLTETLCLRLARHACRLAPPATPIPFPLAMAAKMWSITWTSHKSTINIWEPAFAEPAVRWVNSSMIQTRPMFA